MANEEDLKWIADRLREEFDMPETVYNIDERNKNIIERAERFGLHTLAHEMRIDNNYTTTK